MSDIETLDLASENQRLRERVAQLEAEVPYLKHLSVEGGALDITIEGAKAVTRMMAESLAEMFRAEKAVNYVQYEVRSGEHDYILLLQLASGKTPHQLRQEAEARAAKAEARVAELEAHIRKGDEFIGAVERAEKAERERDAARAEAAMLREALAIERNHACHCDFLADGSECASCERIDAALEETPRG